MGSHNHSNDLGGFTQPDDGQPPNGAPEAPADTTQPVEATLPTVSTDAERRQSALSDLNLIVSAISENRLRRYRMRVDKGAWEPALARYLWNIEIARAMIPVLHAAEVSLRNHIFDTVGAVLTAEVSTGRNALGCWLDCAGLLTEKEEDKVNQAKADYLREQLRKSKQFRKPMTAGHLVAALHFGFWSRLLDGDYANWREPRRAFWNNEAFKAAAFPQYLGGAGNHRDAIHERFVSIKELRNRVFHHERFYHSFSIADYDQIIEAIRWIHPSVATALEKADRPRLISLLENGYQALLPRLLSHFDIHRPSELDTINSKKTTEAPQAAN
jgi:hypothetical protein